jgi:hypothetical protein
LFFLFPSLIVAVDKSFIQLPGAGPTTTPASSFLERPGGH